MVKSFRNFFLSYIALILLPIVLISQELVKTNEEILKELTQQALTSFLNKIDKEDTIIIRYQNDDKAQFINEFIIEYLKNVKQYNLKLLGNEKNILEYYIKKLEVLYSKPFREKIFSEKKFLRNINLEISFKYLRNHDLVEYSSIPVSYIDTVSYQSVKYIENEMIPVTSAKFPEDNTIEKYILPVITITTVSVIVYLFFIIRK